MKFTATCIQTNATNNMLTNIEFAIDTMDQAKSEGAEFFLLPENAVFMANGYQELLANSYAQEEHPALETFKNWAKENHSWVLVGSVAVTIADSDKLANRSVLIDNNGSIVATYDKIHLYDASVKGGETHQESKRFMAGNKAVIADTPWGKLGLTICYDLRFPALYQSLAQGGASIIAVPSAFTHFTGQAHWSSLLRARAIETGCFIIAPAQTGLHPAGRTTYGHSLIIDPWGGILADAGEETGYCLAELDLAKVHKVRESLPVLEHSKEFDTDW